MVKVVEVSDSSQQKTLRGHEAPVLSVAMDPKDVYLVGYGVFFFLSSQTSPKQLYSLQDLDTVI